jgi:hypothetical protein
VSRTQHFRGQPVIQCLVQRVPLRRERRWLTKDETKNNFVNETLSQRVNLAPDSSLL